MKYVYVSCLTDLIIIQTLAAAAAAAAVAASKRSSISSTVSHRFTSRIFHRVVIIFLANKINLHLHALHSVFNDKYQLYHLIHRRQWLKQFP